MSIKTKTKTKTTPKRKVTAKKHEPVTYDFFKDVEGQILEHLQALYDLYLGDGATEEAKDSALHGLNERHAGMMVRLRNMALKDGKVIFGQDLAHNPFMRPKPEHADNVACLNVDECENLTEPLGRHFDRAVAAEEAMYSLDRLAWEETVTGFLLKLEDGEHLRIEENSVYFKRHDGEHVLGECESQDEAVLRAEQWVQANRPHLLNTSA